MRDIETIRISVRIQEIVACIVANGQYLLAELLGLVITSAGYAFNAVRLLTR